jgi:hypothetical protein
MSLATLGDMGSEKATSELRTYIRKRRGVPVLVENSVAGLTWNFDVAMIGARVREAGLPAAGDGGVVACVAGAVLLI